MGQGAVLAQHQCLNLGPQPQRFTTHLLTAWHFATLAQIDQGQQLPCPHMALIISTSQPLFMHPNPHGAITTSSLTCHVMHCQLEETPGHSTLAVWLAGPSQKVQMPGWQTGQSPPAWEPVPRAVHQGPGAAHDPWKG